MISPGTFPGSLFCGNTRVLSRYAVELNAKLGLPFSRNRPVENLPLEINRTFQLPVMVEIFEPTEICVLPIPASTEEQVNVAQEFIMANPL